MLYILHHRYTRFLIGLIFPGCVLVFSCSNLQASVVVMGEGKLVLSVLVKEVDVTFFCGGNGWKIKRETTSTISSLPSVWNQSSFSPISCPQPSVLQSLSPCSYSSKIERTVRTRSPSPHATFSNARKHWQPSMCSLQTTVGNTQGKVVEGIFL